MRLVLTALFLSLALGANAQAGTCKQNFTVAGLPLLSQIEYRTSATVPGVSVKTAAKRIGAKLRAEGYSAVKVRGGTVTALQETSGSGRPQSLQFLAQTSGDGVRVTAVFTIQAGQIAGDRVVRDELCRLIASAKG